MVWGQPEPYSQVLGQAGSHSKTFSLTDDMWTDKETSNGRTLVLPSLCLASEAAPNVFHESLTGLHECW